VTRGSRRRRADVGRRDHGRWRGNGRIKYGTRRRFRGRLCRRRRRRLRQPRQVVTEHKPQLAVHASTLVCWRLLAVGEVLVPFAVTSADADGVVVRGRGARDVRVHVWYPGPINDVPVAPRLATRVEDPNVGLGVHPAGCDALVEGPLLARLGADARKPFRAMQMPLEILEAGATGQCRVPTRILQDARLHRPLHFLEALVALDGCMAART